jgi:hypothetical protein
MPDSVVCLGLYPHKGGAVVIGLALEHGVPKLRLSEALATHATGDRLLLEPFHVASELPRGPGGKASPEAAKAVAEGRARQDRLAEQGLSAIVDRLTDEGFRPMIAAMLVNRAGWITDLLEYSLGWAEHAAVAEGLAVRDALRFAVAACGLEMLELDQKTLPDRAATAIGLPSAEIDARLKALGVGQAPWRKEQKLACLAAWIALGESR